MKKEEFQKYVYRPYHFNYSKLFNSEKTKLKKILGKNVLIEHIGSTAVKGLGGKGIIDVLVGANKKDFSKIKKKLQKHKYLVSVGGDKNRVFIEKDYKYSRKIRRVHVHLVPKNSKEWRNPLKTRDALRKNKKLRDEYTKIKIKAVVQAKGTGKVYRDMKNKFLSRIK